MSFILDALKKSEKERQREAIPGLGDAPIVVHRTHTSIWVFAVIAALGLGVVAFAWAWWRSSAPAPIAAVATPAPSASVAPAAEPQSALAESQPATPPQTRSLAAEATRMNAATSRAQAATTPSGAVVVQSAPPVITPAPMSILAARSAGLAVPELSLELLVYSDIAAQRFVFVNGSKYVEGDTLAEGPRLVEISPEGAILSFSGQNFLLPQE